MVAFSLEGKGQLQVSSSVYQFELMTINIAEYPLPIFKREVQNSFKVQKAPSAYRYEELGAFCKLEVQLEQKFKFPVKIRLGEVSAVEYKEGKKVTKLSY